MSITPIARPVWQALGRTTLRRLVTRYEDWADTAKRAAAHWRSQDNDVEAARSAGEALAYQNCANEARILVAVVFPEESFDE